MIWLVLGFLYALVAAVVFGIGLAINALKVSFKECVILLGAAAIWPVTGIMVLRG